VRAISPVDREYTRCPRCRPNDILRQVNRSRRRVRICPCSGSKHFSDHRVPILSATLARCR